MVLTLIHDGVSIAVYVTVKFLYVVIAITHISHLFSILQMSTIICNSSCHCMHVANFVYLVFKLKYQEDKEL